MVDARSIQERARFLTAHRRVSVAQRSRRRFPQVSVGNPPVRACGGRRRGPGNPGQCGEGQTGRAFTLRTRVMEAKANGPAPILLCRRKGIDRSASGGPTNCAAAFGSGEREQRIPTGDTK